MLSGVSETKSQNVSCADCGPKLRARPESFADHFTQARLFWLSMTKPEQDHIVNGFAFELAKVETVAVRRRMLGQLENVHASLAEQVAAALGMAGQAERIPPAVDAADAPRPSPALSLIAKAPQSIVGRKIGVLVTDGADDRLLDALRKRITAEGARVVLVAPKVGGVTTAAKKQLPAEMSLSGAPSAIFDAVVVAAGEAGMPALLREAAATDWVRDAFGHLKTIGLTAAAEPLLAKAGVAVDADEGVVRVDGRTLDAFVGAAKRHRIWDREPTLRTPG